MSNHNQNRIQPGLREGGQFAHTPRSESPVSLLDQPRAAAELTDEQLMVEAMVASRHQAHVKGLRYTAPEDIAQSTIETVLAARSRNPSRVVTRAYVRQIASGHVAILMRGSLRPEDRKAIGIYQDIVAERQAELGRPLTGAESDAIAHDIREGWHDPRHKPSKDFVRLAAQRTYSLDAPAASTDGEGMTLGDLVEDFSDESLSEPVLDADSIAGQAYLDATGSRKKIAKRNAWRAFAELRDLPSAATGQLDPARARALKATIVEAGGIGAACESFDHGNDDDVVRAMFAPFGHTDGTQRENLVEAFQSHPAYAQNLWDAAVREATGPKPTAESQAEQQEVHQAA